MEAPPDPGPHASASAAAPLRAPEVARLREEQEKVTGRGPAPRFRRWSREAPAPRLVRGARIPLPGGRLPPAEPLLPSLGRSPAAEGPARSRPRAGEGARPLGLERERARREKLSSRAFVVFCLEPFDLRGEGRDGEEGCDCLSNVYKEASF